MNLCDKVTLVEVSQTPEGTFAVKVTSPCANVMEFATGLEELSIADLTDKANSKVFDRMRVTKMSADCLVPAGILTAAWFEAGMLAKSLARSKKNNNIEFIVE